MKYTIGYKFAHIEDSVTVFANSAKDAYDKAEANIRLDHSDVTGDVLMRIDAQEKTGTDFHETVQFMEEVLDETQHLFLTRNKTA
jgi:hypothetical protein